MILGVGTLSPKTDSNTVLMRLIAFGKIAVILILMFYIGYLYLTTNNPLLSFLLLSSTLNPSSLFSILNPLNSNPKLFLIPNPHPSNLNPYLSNP